MKAGVLVIPILLVAFCAGCAADAPGSATVPSVAPFSTEPSESDPVPSLATAPPDLQGSWQATISTGEEVTLTFRPSGYTVDRAGAIGSGSIEVDANRIVFSSARCDLGSGAYDWSIEDGTLAFTPIEPRDPCANRIVFLEDASYSRVE